MEGAPGNSNFAYIMFHLRNPLAVLKLIMLITEIGMFFYGVTGSLYAYKVKKQLIRKQWVNKLYKRRHKEENFLNRCKAIILNIDKLELEKRYGYEAKGRLRKIYKEIKWRYIKNFRNKNPYLERFFWWFIVWLICRIIYYLLIWKWFPFKGWELKKLPIEYERIGWKLWEFFKVRVWKEKVLYVWKKKVLYVWKKVRRRIRRSESFKVIKIEVLNYVDIVREIFEKLKVFIYYPIKYKILKYYKRILNWYFGRNK